MRVIDRICAWPTINSCVDRREIKAPKSECRVRVSTLPSVGRISIFYVGYIQYGLDQYAHNTCQVFFFQTSTILCRTRSLHWLIVPISVYYYLELRNGITICWGCHISTKQSHLCSIMSDQPTELLLLKIEFMCKTLLHCVILLLTHTYTKNVVFRWFQTFLVNSGLKCRCTPVLMSSIQFQMFMHIMTIVFLIFNHLHNDYMMT